MKYLIMVLSNERSLAHWETLTDEQRMEFGRAHMALTEKLTASGDLVVSEGLVPAEMSKRVSVRDGATVVKDGPFAEVKEHLAGFYLVECSEERAIEWAAQVPDALFNDVEVRPIFDMSLLSDEEIGSVVRQEQ